MPNKNMLLSSSSSSVFYLANYDAELRMDSTDFPVSRSPRKELQGPRPPALKVSKDSHKIRKPPMAPQPSQQPQNHHQQTQPRPPVIIYTVSPKVIHTNPSEFMNLVQRLTGPSSSPVSTSTVYNTSANPFTDDGGAISPAARYATVEKARSPKETMKSSQQQQQQQGIGDLGNLMEGIEMSSQIMERSGNIFPGILSPGPASLPAISPNFFSPASDPHMLNFFHDLSPGVNRSLLEGNTLMPSPSTCFASPTPSIDLFNNFTEF